MYLRSHATALLTETFISTGDCFLKRTYTGKAVDNTTHLQKWETKLPQSPLSGGLNHGISLPYGRSEFDETGIPRVYTPSPQNPVQYLLHVGIAHGLSNALPFIVAGSGSYWIHVAPVILTLRVDFRI